MPVIDTKNFGPLRYDPGDALVFPRGLPAFENCREFLALTVPPSEPLIFLQSLEDSGLCFITTPILVVDSAYRLQIGAEDLELIGLPPRAAPVIGKDLLCLAVLSLREEGPTANLLAPVVVNLRNRRAVQAVAQESGYSHQQPLLAAGSPPAVAEEACLCTV
jgi:flagellar assembly factor FliW